MFTGHVSLGLFTVNPRRDVYRNLKILAFAPVLNEKLKIASQQDLIDEHVTKTRLHRRMKMELWLFNTHKAVLGQDRLSYQW